MSAHLLPTAGRRVSPVVALLALGTLAGCAADTGARPAAAPGAAATLRVQPDGTHGAAVPAPARPALPARVPGLGPATRARVPAQARQVLVVTGRAADSADATAVLWTRTGHGWRPGAAWPAHNALHGWSRDHWAGDLRSPIGVFTLTAAGGRLPDPGTGLPYSRSRAFSTGGTGFTGEPLAGSFDYVVAIDYNRVPGTSPLDAAKPLGASRGGGIWLHVDHGGPTHGCVSLTKDRMKQLLRALKPGQHPVVVMGDAHSLAS
ncbi:L,D-transpeptidase family protein [Streptomyces sp. NPDC092296]|uniref:L,D-transpeptidase family protein n=1 Tax=Streptomyces sp. NPDC092296 TaxID=3366012 RepID=UPI00380DAB26